MNLVPDKQKAFNEVHRVLKTGGHFSISDIVFKGTMPEAILEAAELHAGCIAGAIEKGDYLGIIKSTGFKNIQIKKERMITLPDELLLTYTNKDDLEAFKKSGSGIYSITIYADKLDEGSCCDTSGSGCCSSTTADMEFEQIKETCCMSVADSVCC
jgi:SAM-dependent methyltransferase